MTAPTPLSLEGDARLVDETGERSLSLTEDGPWTGRDPVEAQSDFERRAVARDNIPPRTTHSLSLQRGINQVVRQLSRSRILTALFTMFFAAALALIWYTANHRVILIDNAYTAQAERGQLETELLEKNRTWSSERMQTLRDSVANADRRRVFFDYATLADWLRDESRVAEAMSLEFAYTLAKTESSRMAHVDEVAVSIRVHVPMTHDDSAYPDLMRFLREMIKTPWYVEIIDASISSDDRGARDLEAQLRIWVHDKVNAAEVGNND